MITTSLWILISVQIALGAFDTLFHHEFTERLAWRRSQRLELQLHGIRNLFYAVLFVGLGTVELTGGYAWVVIAILVTELLITLKDFVEEDQTRKLPPSERVTHTLLALNYGAILVLLVPVLLEWSTRPAGISIVDHGLWTILMIGAGTGVTLFGLRDLAASRRLARMTAIPPEELLDPLPNPGSVLITGGTGFIGSRLVEALASRGHAVTVLTRDMETAAGLSAPVRLVTSLDQIRSDERIDAIVNLAGEPVAGGLWTARRKLELMRSRVETTRGLVALMGRLAVKPRCLVSGSAIGVYGIDCADPVDERTPVNVDGSFSQKLCSEWEAEAMRARRLGVRTVLLRTGLVLETSGGTLAQMLVPFEFGVGGTFGDGRHWMSWITRDDLVRLIGHCLQDERIQGPVNGVAPAPVTNREFVRTLGAALHRPAILATPRIVLETALGGLGRELLLGSQNVLPVVARETGFRFLAPTLSSAFSQLFGSGRDRSGGRARGMGHSERRSGAH